ncbi:MAG: hypothetical protein FJY65_09740 [Calditrichaeota bacterium]|nr:hypothetical protein [Calditrichota bacterium]
MKNPENSNYSKTDVLINEKLCYKAADEGIQDCLKMQFFPPSTRRSQRQNIVNPIDTLPTTAGRQRKQAFSDSLVRLAIY